MSASIDDADEIEGTGSEISRHRGLTGKRMAGGAAVFVLVVGGAWLWWMMSSHEATIMPMAAFDASTASAGSLVPPKQDRDPPPPPAKSNLPPPGGAVGSLVRKPTQFSMLTDDEWKKKLDGVHPTPPAASVGGGGGTTPAENDKDRPGVFAGPRAWINPHPEMTIPSHTKIHCVPDGPITSEVEGPITCMVHEPVYAETGTLPLIDPGSFIEGQITHGLSNGVTRLYVELERIRTPQHARIPIKGLGADALGENGIDGNLDTHLMRRLGAGVAMAVIQGGIQAGVAVAGSAGGNNNVVNQFGSPLESSGDSLAQTVLSRDINIQDTLIHQQGYEITVVTLGDIDLSGIYKLEMRGDR